MPYTTAAEIEKAAQTELRTLKSRFAKKLNSLFRTSAAPSEYSKAATVYNAKNRAIHKKYNAELKKLARKKK